LQKGTSLHQKRRSLAASSGALQNSVALLKSLAILLRNADCSARVFSNDRDAAAQVGALKAVNCGRFYRQQACRGRRHRPDLQRLLDQLRKGDVLALWKLDRLSRSTVVCRDHYGAVGRAQSGMRSLTKAIDSTTPAKRMMISEPLWRLTHCLFSPAAANLHGKG